ncbi:DUF397 domain-containing protein [Sphaerisporangium sp. NPDC049002]|uniref:DUF397 domain-containing protein n=1 Tax=unclassified Sphaerisporangium TaxID=2630420 RepID=UPI0033E7FF2B
MAEQVDLAGAAWRKSSFSGGGNDCLEIAEIGGDIALRDSKNPCGPVLRLGRGEWRNFIGHLRAGDFGM